MSAHFEALLGSGDLQLELGAVPVGGAPASALRGPGAVSRSWSRAHSRAAPPEPVRPPASRIAAPRPGAKGGGARATL